MEPEILITGIGASVYLGGDPRCITVPGATLGSTAMFIHGSPDKMIEFASHIVREAQKLLKKETENA